MAKLTEAEWNLLREEMNNPRPKPGEAYLCGMLQVARHRGARVSKPDEHGGVPLDWAAYREATSVFTALGFGIQRKTRGEREMFHRVLRKRQRRWARVLTGRETA